MPLAAALGRAGDAFSHPGLSLPAVDPGRVVLLGVRSLDPAERAMIRETGIRAITMTEIDRIGIERAITEAIDRVSGPGFVHAEGPVEQRAGGSRLVGIPYLAEDLSLSGNEGVEPGCNAEQVQRRRLVRQPVRDRCERARVRSRKREERAIRDLACLAVARRYVELGAVAGRENDRLDLTVAAPRELLRQRPCGRWIDGDALTELDGCRVMRDACERDLHDAKWVRGRTTPTSVKPTTSDHASRRPWRPISRRRTRAVA